jgi:DHA3 family macrolide efflux protein-like MFS transporter
MNARSQQMAQATALLKNRSFCRLWAAQFFTLTVVYGLTLAGTVLVEDLTHSSTQTGLVILSAILPAFLASLVSGAVVDRYGRRRVLLASHAARGVVALAFWAGTRFLPTNLALVTVYAVNVAGVAFTQFAAPAELALLPDLVGRSRLLSANTLFQLSMLAAEGLGIVVLSPLTIKLFGASAMGLLSAGLCLLAVVLVVALPRDPSSAREKDRKGSIRRDLADLQAGWLTIAHDRLLSLVAIQATLAATLLLVLLSLLPGLMSQHLGLGVENVPLLVLPGGLGFALGAFLVSRWGNRLGRATLIAIGFTGVGVSIALISVLSGGAGRLWLVVLPILGMGLFLAPIIIPARVVLQERPPADMRGRVIAAQLALANAFAILPLLLGGSLADHLGIRPVMGLLSVVAMGAGAVGLCYVRS